MSLNILALKKKRFKIMIICKAQHRNLDTGIGITSFLPRDLGPLTWDGSSLTVGDSTQQATWLCDDAVTARN